MGYTCRLVPTESRKIGLLRCRQRTLNDFRYKCLAE